MDLVVKSLNGTNNLRKALKEDGQADTINISYRYIVGQVIRMDSKFTTIYAV